MKSRENKIMFVSENKEMNVLFPPFSYNATVVSLYQKLKKINVKYMHMLSLKILLFTSQYLERELRMEGLPFQYSFEVRFS